MFVLFDDIKELITPASKSLLENDSALFTKIENLAAIIIRDETGLSIPITTDTRPDWIVLPIAQIIDKILANQISSLSKDQHDMIQNNFDNAIKDLRNHVANGIAIDNNHTSTGTLQGTVTW